MSGAASSSITAGSKSGPQNSVNQRPTTALFSSVDMVVSLVSTRALPFGAPRRADATSERDVSFANDRDEGQ